jgi:hypothetical protein
MAPIEEIILVIISEIERPSEDHISKPDKYFMYGKEPGFFCKIREMSIKASNRSHINLV